MKKKRISIYIIALLMLGNFTSHPLKAQTQTTPKALNETTTETPLFQGVYLGIDVFGLANKVLGSDITSTEVNAEMNLKNRFFPVVEVGYAAIETSGEETDIFYKSSAPYFRIGMNYNVFYKKPHLPGQLLVGLRYGYSSFEYDVNAPALTDPNWGHTSVPFAYEGVKSNASWVEVCAGLKTQVYKGFYMGFTVRYRSRLSQKVHENSEPYYIPGFGKNGSTNVGLTYNLIYKLPF